MQMEQIFQSKSRDCQTGLNKARIKSLLPKETYFKYKDTY